MTRRLLLEPGRWSAKTLAAELGEGSPRRVQRVVSELGAAGWTVTREGSSQEQRITLSL